MPTVPAITYNFGAARITAEEALKNPAVEGAVEDFAAASERFMRFVAASVESPSTALIGQRNLLGNEYNTAKTRLFAALQEADVPARQITGILSAIESAHKEANMPKDGTTRKKVSEFFTGGRSAGSSN